jgi:hypothetical protein
MCFCSAGDDSNGGYYEDDGDGDDLDGGYEDDGDSENRFTESGNALPTDARGRGLLYFELVVTVLVVVF